MRDTVYTVDTEQDRIEISLLPFSAREKSFPEKLLEIIQGIDKLMWPREQIHSKFKDYQHIMLRLDFDHFN